MKTMVKLLRDLTPEDKLAPQAAVIVNVLKEHWGVDVEVPRTDVIAKLNPDNLKTRQDPARILSFYQPKLKDVGLVEVIKHVEPKAEKPAKEKKAKEPKEPKAKKGTKQAKENAGDAGTQAAA